MRNHDQYADAYLEAILRRVTSITVVGASEKPDRPSHGVMLFLKARGYRMTAVNPQLTGRDIAGVPVFRTLGDIPYPIDMVDVFRNNAAVPGVVDEVLAMVPKPSVIWMQLGVRDDAAAAKAEAAGLEVVMNRCPAIEIPRLLAT